MREIKFRAWCAGENEMVPWQELIDMEYQFNEFNVKGGLLFLQYTGLKDKNGKGIYEGDIFRIPPDKHHHYEERNSITFYSGCWQLAEHGLYLIDYHERGEVIGNIYENPELLKA